MLNKVSLFAASLVLLDLLGVTTVVPTAAFANESHEEESSLRQLGSHVHGTVVLNAALEDQSLYLELISPAINIVGFEHQPNTLEQEAQIETAKDSLANIPEWLTFPDTVSCELISAAVEHTIDTSEHADHHHDDDHHEEGHHDDDHHDDEHHEEGHHDDDHHDDEHHDEDHHDDHHDDDHDDDHHDDDEHHHDDDHLDGEASQEQSETHSEFQASYQLNCANLDPTRHNGDRIVFHI